MGVAITTTGGDISMVNCDGAWVRLWVSAHAVVQSCQPSPFILVHICLCGDHGLPLAVQCDPTLLGTGRSGVRLTSSEGGISATNSNIQDCDVVMHGDSSFVQTSGLVASNTGGGATILVSTDEGTVNVRLCMPVSCARVSLGGWLFAWPIARMMFSRFHSSSCCDVGRRVPCARWTAPPWTRSVFRQSLARSV